MSGTPLFQITDAGLAAASVATPTGPYIHITSFEIGSGFGYTPQATDVGLNGNLLYSGVPTAYENIGNNTINIICEIPPDAGPFDFGEVALFLDGGVMFAKAVFDTPQTKFSSLGTNVVSSYTLNCLLKLQQSTAVFQIDTSGQPPAVWEVFQWSDVFPPGVSANPDIPLYLVRELNDRGDSTLLQNTSDAEWTVGSTSYSNYVTYGSGGTNSEFFTVANSSTTWVEVAASKCHPADLTTSNRRFLIQTSDGFFRSVSSVTVSGSNYRFNLNCTNDGTYNNSPLQNAPTVGSNLRIYRDDQAVGTIYYSQIVDPPSIPLAVNGVPGLMYGGNGTYMPAPGVVEAHGMLHLPSTNCGRVLTGGDDLNATNWTTGIYTTQSASFGYPANMPVAWDGTIQIENFGSLTQLYKPGSTGGGDGVGNGGTSWWYRSWTGSQWTSWFEILINGKTGTNFWTTSQVQLLTVNGIGTYLFAGAIGGWPVGAVRGNFYSLPGQPGTWMCMSVGGTGTAGKDFMYERVA